MKLKKKFILCIISIIGLVGFHSTNTLSTLFNNNPNQTYCPQYIKDFVELYPQAKELEINYKKEENANIKLNKPEGIPLYIQWDNRWAYTPYGKEIIGTAGCGPTCLSMVAVGLTDNTKYNPRYIAKFAVKNAYLDESKTRWSLMDSGCEKFGIKATNIPLTQSSMIHALDQGHPIIASVRPGNFTNGGHFIVITKSINNKFIVNDPNSYENSERQWTYQELSKQIKALWAYSKL